MFMIINIICYTSLSNKLLLSRFAQRCIFLLSDEIGLPGYILSLLYHKIHSLCPMDGNLRGYVVWDRPPLDKTKSHQSVRPERSTHNILLSENQLSFLISVEEGTRAFSLCSERLVLTTQSCQ